MDKILRTTKKIIPKKIYTLGQPFYHYSFAFLGAMIYRFPSRNIKVIFVTGTKGKSSTVEFINSILEEAGYKTALAGTIRFKIGNTSRKNLYKMTIPGRFFVQKFLRDAVTAGCDYAIIEMTSEGARQYRHKFINIDALVFLNISPEHIESHGSYEKYIEAKLLLGKALEESNKPRKVLVANTDDKEAPRFLAIKIKEKYPFSLDNAKPFTMTEGATELTFQESKISTVFPGTFTIYNVLAAATFALTQNIPPEIIKKGIERVHEIRGRVQKIALPTNHPKFSLQKFSIIVDYAHTADSLEKLYQAFPDQYKIAVLGNTGGGRDTWKRAEMGKIANNNCDFIILTDEDPYDDDPRKIVDEMAVSINKDRLKIIMDRRAAIHEAIAQAVIASKGNKKVAILISGKGTDPYIMRANGKKEPWSDEEVSREELEKVLGSMLP